MEHRADVILVTPQPRHASILAAGVIVSGLLAGIGLEAYEAHVCSTPCLAASLASAAAVFSASAYRAWRARSRWRLFRRKILALPDLIREGVEAEAGRLVVTASYTGEKVKRSYRETIVFRVQGDPQPLDASLLSSWRPRYTLVAFRDEGVIDAEAYRVEVGGLRAYITVLHGDVEVKTSRRRLVARRGDEYAEALLEPQGPELRILLSHVGATTYARLSLRVSSPLEAPLTVFKVRGAARQFTKRFAPRRPVTLVYAEGARIVDVGRVLGYPLAPVAYGHGIEARVRLELVRLGVPRASDEALMKTLQISHD